VWITVAYHNGRTSRLIVTDIQMQSVRHCPAAPASTRHDRTRSTVFDTRIESFVFLEGFENIESVLRNCRWKAFAAPSKISYTPPAATILYLMPVFSTRHLPLFTDGIVSVHRLQTPWPTEYRRHAHA
jgi:hypothetical protein